MKENSILAMLVTSSISNLNSVEGDWKVVNFCIRYVFIVHHA